jgi:hypothetical protein
VSIQRKKSDGTWKLVAYGILGGAGVMLLIQLLRFAGCQ